MESKDQDQLTMIWRESMNGQTEIRKEEVEGLLGFQITDSQFTKALGYASRKQAYIYQRDERPVVMQRWYLVKLTEEYVRSLSFSKYTMDLCGESAVRKKST